MAIAFQTFRLLGSTDDRTCSGLAAYVRRCTRPSGAPPRFDHEHRDGAESALRPPAPLAILRDEVFSRRLSYGERICKAYELNLRLQDLISMLPTELSARQNRQVLEDWVHGQFVQPRVTTVVALHHSHDAAECRCPHPIRRRRG
jgi:hypothetical protein